MLLKTILQKVTTEGKSDMTEQDKEIIQKKINELGELSCDFTSKAYNINQAKIIEILKESRIGGYSIIG